jgi:hypothetical protein
MRGLGGVGLGLLVVMLGAWQARAQVATIRTLAAGASEKVCQLTGERDWASGAPTSTQTQRFGLNGTDLGFPVEHQQRLALLFGDTRTVPNRNSNEVGPPDDAVGWIATRTPPTPDRCTDLTTNTLTPDSNLLVSPTVATGGMKDRAAVPIKQGLFNVPSGGVSTDGWLYGFFWTDHCNNTPTTPCPEREDLNSTGRGVLARSNNNGVTFVDAVPMPRGFVYATAANAVRPLEVSVSGVRRLGVFVFGVPRYRASVPYLAYAPPGTMADPTAWRFFLGLQVDGVPSWTSYEVWQRGKGGPWAPPGKAELLTGPAGTQCVGEHSVTWNRALDVWLLLYNCQSEQPSAKIVARISAAPWGPWSEPVVILDAERDHSFCTLIYRHNDEACKPLADDWPPADHIDGAFYAPFAMERFTIARPNPQPNIREATIFWLLSTYNPYQVTIMRTMLRVRSVPIGSKTLGPASRAAPRIVQ